MHIKIATAIVLSLAFAPQQRGWVSSVTASADATGTAQFTVRGNNPCGAVNLDYGDGSTATTHAITQLPVTLSHDYTRVGEFTVRARGQGNCDGDVFTRVNVTRVRGGGIFDRNPNTNNRYAEMDQNGDGVITRAEWRGTAQGFDQADWNNDNRLSGDEVRAGAASPNRFANWDQNRDGVITRAEWRGTAQEFDVADWNNDGRLSGDEVRSGAAQPNRYQEWDQNRDGVITRAEWRGTAQAFEQADWNNDNRISGDEVRPGATRPDVPDDDDEHTRFAGMDVNGDGVITRNEWRGNANAFNQHDWNGDGRLSGEEVRPGGRPNYEWTDVSFRRFDRNRDNYISGTEWRYEPNGFLQVDRNRDDRISLAEFRAGDDAIRGRADMPGDRGRGRGRGQGNDQTTSILVTNRQTWVDSGIDVRAGDTLDISATGRVQYSPQITNVTGPNGVVGVTRANAPMPNMAVGSLVARVGNSAPFFVGARGNAMNVPVNGRLLFAINDDILTDNSGEFRVTVQVNRR